MLKTIKHGKVTCKSIIIHLTCACYDICNFLKMTSTLQKLKVKNIYAELSLFFQTWPKFIFNHFFMIGKGYSTYFLVHYTLSDFLHFTFLVKFYFGELFLITLSSYFSLVKTTHAFSIWFVIHRGLLLQISFLSQIQNYSFFLISEANVYWFYWFYCFFTYKYNNSCRLH